MEDEYLYTALCGRRISLYCAVWKMNIFTQRCVAREYLYTALRGRRMPLLYAVKENSFTLRCMKENIFTLYYIEGRYLYTVLYEWIISYTEWFGK